jgi:sec-independent protein translocase protein TatC
MTQDADSTPDQPLLEHLLELRNRVLKMIIAVIVCTVVLAPFTQQLYALLADPLMRHLPEGSSMIAIDVATPFLTPFKLTVLTGLMLSIPVIIYQLWAFVAPGLFRHEQHLARPLLVSATLLFYAGCLFAYVVVFPVIFAFFTRVAPAGVSVMTDISRYLDFVIALFFAFGIAFEVPVAIIILVALRVVTPEQLASKRAYVIVGAFAVGMLLTPPDVISQTLLALPMWLLFEFGIIMSKVLVRRREATAGEDG